MTSHISFRRSVKEDLPIISENLHNDNTAEDYGVSTIEALSLSMSASIECTTVEVDGIQQGVFGVGSKTEHGHSFWLVGIENLFKFRREFMVLSRELIDRYVSTFGKIYNYIPAKNKAALYWLKWLGATLSEPVHHGANNTMFIKFTFGGE